MVSEKCKCCYWSQKMIIYWSVKISILPLDREKSTFSYWSVKKTNFTHFDWLKQTSFSLSLSLSKIGIYYKNKSEFSDWFKEKPPSLSLSFSEKFCIFLLAIKKNSFIPMIRMLLQCSAIQQISWILLRFSEFIYIL